MFCPFCGKELKNEPKFCPYCGHPIPEDDSKPLQNMQTDRAMPYSGVQATDLNGTSDSLEVKTALKIPAGYYVLSGLLLLMTIVWGIVAYVCYRYPARLEVIFYGTDYLFFSPSVAAEGHEALFAFLRVLFEATRVMLIVITLLGIICVGNLFGLPIDINLFHRPVAYATKEKTEAKMTRLARNGKVFSVIMAIFYIFEVVLLNSQFEPVGTITLISIGLLTWLTSRKVKKLKA